MYLNLVLVVDISQGIVTGYWVTAAHELILLDVLLRDVYRLFAIELVWYDEEFLLRFFFLLLIADKGDVFQPTTFLIVFFVLTRQFVDVFLPQ